MEMKFYICLPSIEPLAVRELGGQGVVLLVDLVSHCSNDSVLQCGFSCESVSVPEGAVSHRAMRSMLDKARKGSGQYRKARR